MGYGRRDYNIRTLTPDNNESTLYLRSNISLIEMLESIRKHFPNTRYEELTIEAQHIHTDCLGYDLYDPGDYTDYIVVTK